MGLAFLLHALIFKRPATKEDDEVQAPLLATLVGPDPCVGDGHTSVAAAVPDMWLISDAMTAGLLEYTQRPDLHHSVWLGLDI